MTINRDDTLQQSLIWHGLDGDPVSDLDVVGVSSLVQLQHQSCPEPLAAVERDGAHPEPVTSGADMADIRGQKHVKRSLESAAAVGHTVLRCGRSLCNGLVFSCRSRSVG